MHFKRLKFPVQLHEADHGFSLGGSFGGGEQSNVTSEGGQVDNPTLDGATQTNSNPAGQSQMIDFGEGFGQLSVADAQKMMMMNKDYTQKTQALAQERQTLQTQIQEQLQKQFEEQYSPYMQFEQALQQNPQLAQAIQSQMQQHYNPAADLTQNPLFTQMQEQMQAQQQMIEQWQNQQRQAQTENELKSITEKYPDLKGKEKELLEFTVQNNLPNLEYAYKVMNFDNIGKQTEQQMVQNNMKKQVGQTFKPNQAQQETGSVPKNASMSEISKHLLGQNMNLTL